ncbi:hypothetical protein C8Q76DRAFT_280894 [Earliella scabrosa]|nr:hypothetical protein C8Q76DRAFT_280894 [Earliella scabrosa]
MPDVLYVVRRSADSGGKLSTTTILIIAVVSGSVVVLVFALFAWRLLARYCRSSRSVPLPPVQDLAHHREQQLSAFERKAAARPTTWADSALAQPHPRLYSSHFLSASGSSASLIRSSPDFTASRGPTRESSWAVEDATSAESSPYPTPLSEENLMPPNPSFVPGVGPLGHNSMASVASSSSDVVSEMLPNGPPTPSELNHSVESSVSLAHSSAYGSPARPRPPRASRSRSRPMSIVSTSGTSHSIHTSHSTNTLRGPAHSIHSNIQIVLPAPLAPQVYSNPAGGFERTSSFYSSGGDRKSVADPWVLAGSRPPSVARFEREASGSSSRLSSSGPRPSVSRQRSRLSKVASTSSLRDSDSESMKARRSQSQPPVPHAPSAPAVHAPARARTPSPGPSRPSMSFAQPGSPLPPVPRIPSVYGRASLENANSPTSHPARARPPREPSHPRGRDPAPAPVAHALAAAPTPVPGLPLPGPVGVSNPTPPTFPPVPSSSSSYGRATPDRVPSGSGKLRKNRASTQDGRTNHS